MSSVIPAECAARSLGPGNELVTLLVQTLLASYCSLAPTDMWPADCGATAKNATSYDYIIVGAGTAGSVLAERLSEDPTKNVLVIEAGGDPPIETEIPDLFAILEKTRVDWQYYAKAKNGCGSSNHMCFWPRGKMLGGSSSMNFMIYIRGNKANFDYWASLGNKGWDYNSVLKYFKRWENNTDPKIANYDDGYYHGTKGPVKISLLERMKYIQVFLEAAKQKGYRQVCDINADKTLGFLNIQGYVYDGVRYSEAKAYLVPAKDRPNLCIIKNAVAYKILFDANNKAIGVQYNYNGANFTAYANREVIISAGSIESPKLLMLSGIGPKDQLDQFGIPVIKELPGVGENLIDHVACLPFVQLDREPAPATETLDAIFDFLVHKQGALTTIEAFELQGFVNAKNCSQCKGDNPDIQFAHLYFPTNSTNLLYYMSLQNYTPAIIGELQSINQKHHVAAAIPVVIQPKSRGTVKLQSASYLDYPELDANYFGDPDDLDTMVHGIKRAISLLKTKALKKYNAKVIKLPIPECDPYTFESKEYWWCYAQQISETSYHQVGTCKMGPSSDPNAVVDDKLRVYGVTHLRVIDASIMPDIVSGNTNAAVLAIAEKGADMIKEAN